MAINLSGLLKATGAGFAGYGEDKRQMLGEAMASRAAERQARLDAIDAAIKARTLRTPVLGDANYARAQGDVAAAQANARVPAAVAQATQVAPVEVQKAADIAAATAGTAQATHATNRDYDNAHPAPVQPSFSFPTATGVDGKAEVFKANNKTGEIEPTGVAGKQSSAKLTEPQEKSYLFYNLMKTAEPDIDRTISGGKVRPAAITAYLRSGPFDAAVNTVLNDDEQQLIRAARDFTAGVLRKESGAAITHDEIKQTLERYFPSFGDQGPVGQSKTQARKAYMHTMEQEAGPAIQFYGRQKPADTPPTDTRQPVPIPSFEDWLKKNGHG